MTETNTATGAGTENIAATLQARFDSLTARAQTAAESYQAAVPLTDRPIKAQEAFMLGYSDLQLLQFLCKDAKKKLAGINLEALTPDQLKDADSLSAAMAELAHDLIDAVVDSFGVSREIVMPTCIKDLARQIDLIETIVVRMEAGLLDITAA